MKTFETHKGKTIEMFYKGRNIALKFKEGGELPEELTGIYTGPLEAELAVLRYLDRHTPKHKKSTISVEEEAALQNQEG